MSSHFFFQPDNPKAKAYVFKGLHNSLSHSRDIFWSVSASRSFRWLSFNWWTCGSEISTHISINFLYRIASFQYNIKWSQRVLCVAITNSQFLKKYFNNKCTVCNGQSYDHNWSYLRKKNGKTLDWWNHDYHLPKFTSTT